MASGFGRDAMEFLRSVGACPVDGGETANSGVRINSISPMGSEKVVVRVTVSNPSGREEAEFLILREHSESLELKIGDIEEELLPELEYFVEVARAYSSACSSFAYTCSSVSMLMKKLILKGFPRDVSADAIECVKARGFIDEKAIAVRRVQVLSEKHWGRSRILLKLREEGFGAEAMSAASEELDGIDFSDSCAELIRKRFGSIPEEKNELDKMYASLSRMGFSPSDIKAAMSLLK